MKKWHRGIFLNKFRENTWQSVKIRTSRLVGISKEARPMETYIENVKIRCMVWFTKCLSITGYMCPIRRETSVGTENCPLKKWLRCWFQWEAARFEMSWSIILIAQQIWRLLRPLCSDGHSFCRKHWSTCFTVLRKQQPKSGFAKALPGDFRQMLKPTFPGILCLSVPTERLSET